MLQINQQKIYLVIKIIKKQKDSIAYEKNIIKEIELLESVDHPKSKKE